MKNNVGNSKCLLNHYCRQQSKDAENEGNVSDKGDKNIL